jgi:hypothetical protein
MYQHERAHRARLGEPELLEWLLRTIRRTRRYVLARTTTMIRWVVYEDTGESGSREVQTGYQSALLRVRTDTG